MVQKTKGVGGNHPPLGSPKVDTFSLPIFLRTIFYRLILRVEWSDINQFWTVDVTITGASMSGFRILDMLLRFETTAPHQPKLDQILKYLTPVKLWEGGRRV